LQTFLDNSTAVTLTFQTDKEDGRPATSLTARDSSGYEEARHAIAEALEQVLQSHSEQKDGVTHSVHYSDINGLSRLENYILGLEIATYLSESDTTLIAIHLLTVTRRSRLILPLVHFNAFATYRSCKRILDISLSTSYARFGSSI
jgi:hypothetical protein